MQIILREDVEFVGKRGDVVNVAGGYARNYLLRRKLALVASPGNLKTFDLQKGALALREQKDKTDAEVVAGELGKWEAVVSRKAGESGALFGSVTSSNINDLLAAKGIRIDRRKIQLREPVKMLGRYEIPIRLHPEVTVLLPLNVVGETQKEREGMRERQVAPPEALAVTPTEAAAETAQPAESAGASAEAGTETELEAEMEAGAETEAGVEAEESAEAPAKKKASRKKKQDAQN